MMRQVIVNSAVDTISHKGGRIRRGASLGAPATVCDDGPGLMVYEGFVPITSEWGLGGGRSRISTPVKPVLRIQSAISVFACADPSSLVNIMLMANSVANGGSALRASLKKTSLTTAS